MRSLIYNARLVATMDDRGSELAEGYVLVDGDKIDLVGRGTLPSRVPVDVLMDARGRVILPGLVNTHHHLFQTLTRNVPTVQEAPLFRWLTELYQIWRNFDAESLDAAVRVGLGELLLTGCTTTTDHTYLFPRGQERFIDVQIAAARELGIRFHPGRGSMSRGKSQGGLPPDEVVQTEEEILSDCERLIHAYHDPNPGAMVRIDLAPCSPFSVSRQGMEAVRDLGRRAGVRLHTHLAETLDEERFCLEKFGARPVEYVESLGWTGPDVWHAHCVHLNTAEIDLFARTGSGVAHCPSSNMRLASGIAPVRAMRDAGVRVGLGVDGSASNDSSHLLAEARQAMLLQRVNGNPAALGAQEALEIATLGGASVLGRDDIGALAPGMAADFIGYRLARLEFAGALHDPLAALVFCTPPAVDLSVINGRVRVQDGQILGLDLPALIRRHDEISRAMIRET